MKKALFSAIFAGFALFGCIADNTPKEPSGSKGIARIKLPELPAGVANTGPAAEYNLAVTVSGPGMASVTQSWNLSGFGGKTVSFENIPAGSGRTFTGTLMRGRVITHEGKYSINIGGGESVFVPLVLRDIRNGRAEICVEVEGWPGSPDCRPIDTLPVDTFALAGCWYIEANEGGLPIKGRLSFQGRDDANWGEFTFENGHTLFANAEYIAGAWRISLHPFDFIDDMPRVTVVDPLLDEPSARNNSMPIDIAPDTTWYRTYHFRIDTFSFGPADQPNGLFWGVMMDPTFTKTLGKVTGSITQCHNIIDPPIIDPIDTSICILPRPFLAR